MRIPPTGKSPGIGPAPSAQPGTAASHLPAARADHVELSVLSQAVAGLAPNRLQEIQASVHSGTYGANAAKVSRSIVDFYLIPAE